MSSDAASPRRAYNLDEIRFIREEVKFQHTMIGTRISWFVSSQAFLVTPFAICVSNQLTHTYLLALGGIATLGIVLSVLIMPASSRRFAESTILTGFWPTLTPIICWANTTPSATPAALNSPI
jgi:hypothetical protein